jgi:hypothetical protein
MLMVRALHWRIAKIADVSWQDFHGEMPGECVVIVAKRR